VSPNAHWIRGRTCSWAGCVRRRGSSSLHTCSAHSGDSVGSHSVSETLTWIAHPGPSVYLLIIVPQSLLCPRLS
jgi:hypothetical protein